jgi:hypothetical protein
VLQYLHREGYVHWVFGCTARDKAAAGWAVFDRRQYLTGSTAPICERRKVARESAGAVLLHCEFTTPADFDREVPRSDISRPFATFGSMRMLYKLSPVLEVTSWRHCGAIVAGLALSAQADHR